MENSVLEKDEYYNQLIALKISEITFPAIEGRIISITDNAAKKIKNLLLNI